MATLPSPQPVPPEAVPETSGPLVEQPEETASSPEPPAPQPPATSPPASSQTSTPPETPAAPVPALGQMLTVEQRKQYNQAIDLAMSRAKELLAVFLENNPRPSDQQHTAIKRIQAFIQQADEQRGQDLTIARNLAERAKVLAEDLAKGLK